MFGKKPLPAKPKPLNAFEQGWTPSLLESIFNSRSERNGLKTWDIMTHLHGIKLEANNTEVLRYGYGMTFVSDRKANESEDISILMRFIRPSQDPYKDFFVYQNVHEMVESFSDVQLDEDERIYGYVGFEGRSETENMHHSDEREIHKPILEWFLYLNDSEHDLLDDAIRMATSENPVRIGVRAQISSDAIEIAKTGKFLAIRLPICRLWITSVREFWANALKANYAYYKDD